MFRKPFRALAGLAVVSLLAGALALPAGAATHSAASVQGVTSSEIDITAIVSDLDGLRAKFGNVFSAKLTTGNLLKRWQSLADAYGPINGRKVVVKGAVWDPTDNTTFDKACTQATQDQKAFLVVQGNGYRPSSIGCVTVDNKTPFFFGESVYPALQQASGDNLFSLGVPSDLSGLNTVLVAKEQNLIPTTAKIGILSANEPGVKAAGDAAEAEAKKVGYTVASKIEVNSLSADPTIINRETAASVATFKAAGVDTVISAVNFTQAKGYYTEVANTNAGFKTILVDAASSMCTIYGASQIPASMAGSNCVTTWDTRSVPAKNAVKKDNAFEAECRKQFDTTFAETSQPGAPAGDKTVNGVNYTEDFAPNECTIMSVLLPAIKKAGKSLTWAKVAANLKKTTKAPAAYMSDGTGGFGPKKNYFATSVHSAVLVGADGTTAKDASGLYGGCPIPVQCFVPLVGAGSSEWVPIKTK